ncbi:MAG: bifunctional (p)ppGpp synthetase/guanosine-3',5'-bis(diphosphate) 3'-pyrophosphohydrolase [Burkholderiaceae bacterium]|jgi:GTP pyrophosphokinase|nr:bifunctional (p)ppGpp synthetase/guanosine-3',5'-bis(diphosphate) 3'-pyrophosphohydrolase [Burkholderiaceae bacterium]
MSALTPPTTASADALPPDVAVEAARISAASFAALESKIAYLGDEDRQLLGSAYRFADRVHLGQMRKNGEPYITHPIAVASQCADWKLDTPALIAALLHDAMEDCDVTKSDLAEQFGSTVSELVDGLTKLDKLQFDNREENQAESFRKMLLAMARDVRVILIKLADRTHNMRTLGDMPRRKWERISTETLEVYAPIAHRLGLNQTYRELQDLAFRHLMPWRYSVLSKAIQRAHQRRRDLIQNVQRELETALVGAGLTASVIAREKTLYSIYRKMDEKRLSFAQVNDLYGLRVIVSSVASCYFALGLLHQIYKPVPGRFKDYIAIPKINGYQALHTTLIGPAHVNMEVQIRTEQMDIVAESGVAAHWLYKVSGGASKDDLGSQWLQSLLDIQQETRDPTEFLDNVKGDLIPDAVYVFTPKGQIMALPNGATVVDFAYAIHSSVGDHTVAAKVNGEQVPLRSELSNGDVVEIVTAPVSSPNPAWLGFVRTGRARSKIRHYLKTLAQNESAGLGEKMLAQALRSEGLAQLPADDDAQSQDIWEKLLRFTGNRTREELMADIGLGKRVASIVANRLASLLQAQGVKPDALMLTRERFTEHEKLSQGAVVLDGSDNAAIKYATCCRPIPGDPVVGYLGRGEGLVVHTADCTVARRLRHKDAERFITVEWSDESTRTFPVGVAVTVSNGKGVLARLAAALTNADADIVHMGMADESARDAAEMRFILGVRNTAHLDAVLRLVRRTPSVLRAARIKPAASA